MNAPERSEGSDARPTTVKESARDSNRCLRIVHHGNEETQVVVIPITSEDSRTELT